MKKNKKPSNHYRQGDVLIEEISMLPSTAKVQKKSKDIILAHGTATGHHHRVVTTKPVIWSKEGEITSSSEKSSTLAGAVFISLPNGGKVTHDEHETITLPAGNYKASRQREYTPTAIRNVAD